MPAKAYDRTSKETLRDHPASHLIHDEANPWTSAQDLREHVTTDALMTGNGYALVTRDSAGTPLELHRLDPQAVQVERQPDGEGQWGRNFLGLHKRNPPAIIRRVR